jgi:hypothetical protein
LIGEIQNSVHPRSPAIKAKTVGRTTSVKLVANNELKLEYKLPGLKNRTDEGLNAIVVEFPGNTAEMIESEEFTLSMDEASNA